VSALPEQNPELPALLVCHHKCFRVRLLCLLVLHELTSDHHTFASHLSNHLALLLNSLKLFQQKTTYLLCVFSQFFFPNDVQHLTCDSHLKRTSSVRGVVLVRQRLAYLSAGHYGSQRNTISDGFCNYHDIWLDSQPLETPRLPAYSAKTSLHLIRNVQSTHFSYHFLYSLGVLRY